MEVEEIPDANAEAASAPVAADAAPAPAAAPAAATAAAANPIPNPTRPPVPYANCDPIMQQRRDRTPHEDQTYALLRLKGVYFDSYDSIWTINNENFVAGDFTFLDAIRREGGPGMMDPVAHFEDRFPAMRRGIYSGDSRTTSVNFQGMDIFGRTYPDRVHLVPHTPTACAAYGPLAEAAMGVRMNTQLQRAKLIRGTKRCGGEKRNGLRYSPYNLLPLSQQGSFFDNLPYIMVIPCVDLPFVLNWTPGQPYACMVVAGGSTVGGEGDAELIDAYKTLLRETYLYCNEQEATDATDLLAAFVRAAACCIRNEQSLRLFDQVTNAAESSRLRNLFANHPHGIPVPSMTTGVDFHHRRLAKLSFPVQGTNDHIPDPFLLLIKAMVCFSASQNCRLMPYIYRRSYFDDTSEESQDGDAVSLESIEGGSEVDI